MFFRFGISYCCANVSHLRPDELSARPVLKNLLCRPPPRSLAKQHKELAKVLLCLRLQRNLPPWPPSCGSTRPHRSTEAQSRPHSAYLTRVQNAPHAPRQNMSKRRTERHINWLAQQYVRTIHEGTPVPKTSMQNVPRNTSWCGKTHKNGTDKSATSG